MSVLFISHDLGLVGEIADHVVVMRQGIVREQGPVAEIFEAPQDAYTKALLPCRPRLDGKPQAPAGHRRPHAGQARSQIGVTEPRIARAVAAAPLIEAKGLRKEFRLKTGLFARKTVEAVKDASFALHPGHTLGVVGESGSGKTTVGLTLLRLLEATAGAGAVRGQGPAHAVRRRDDGVRRKIQIVFQNPYARLNPRFTIGQTLIEPMKIHGIGASDGDREQARALARRGRAGGRRHRQVPARVLRRPAPAHRDRALPDAEARGAGAATRRCRRSTYRCRPRC